MSYYFSVCLLGIFLLGESSAAKLLIDDPLPPRPRLMWNASELASMRERVLEGQYPHALAGERLLESLKQPLAPDPESSDQTMVFYNALIEQGARARDLALAWWITEDEAYAEQAMEFILAWANARPTPGYVLKRPNGEWESRSGMYLARASLPMIAAADLLWGSYDDFDPATQEALTKWLRKLELRMRESIDAWEASDYFGEQYYQNHLVAHAMGLAAIGSLLGDVELLHFALDHEANPRDMVELIEGTVLMEGDTVHRRELKDAPPPQNGEIYDRYREHTAGGRGLQYAHLSLNLLAAAAEVYRPLGVDLWNYKAAGGETLRLPFEFYADFFRLRDGRLKGGFYAGVNPGLFNKADTLALFELGLARFPESAALQQLIFTLDRPIHRDHVMGPLILTQGLVFPSQKGLAARSIWAKPERDGSSLSGAPPSLLSEHPRLLLRSSELRVIREAIASNNPLAVPGWERLQANAQLYLGVSPKPYIGRDTGIFHRFALADARMARDLALAWRLGGDAAWAQRAAYILDRWSRAHPLPATNFGDSPMDNNKGMLIGRSLLPMMWAYDLLEGSPYLDPSVAANFRNWLRSLLPTIESAEAIWESNGYFDHQYVQNHQVGKLLGQLSIAITLGDEALYRRATDGPDNLLAYTHLLEQLILMPGDPVYYREPPGTVPPQAGEIVDRYRHFEMAGHMEGYVTYPLRGLQYCNLSLRLLSLCARMAEVNGLPLASYKAPGGEHLKHAFEFYAPFYSELDSSLRGGFYSGESERLALPGAGDRPAVFELGALLYPDAPDIRAPLAQSDRALDQTILVGHDALVFGVLAEDASHTDELSESGGLPAE